MEPENEYSETHKNRRKISVLTSHYIPNYGSVLQAYATQIFWEELEYEVEFINYMRANVRNKGTVNPKWNTNKIRIFIYVLYRKIDSYKKGRVFSGFIKKHLRLSKPYKNKEDLLQEPPKADLYCVGSDQVWNSEYNGGVLPETFLDFAPAGSKKISFSSSMGMIDYSEKEKQQMKRFLKDFCFISVREKDALDILSNMGFGDVQLLLDPTLLISAERWQREISHRMQKKRYVCIYQLNENPGLIDLARKLAKEDNLQIIRITYYMMQRVDKVHCIYCPTVSEFLSLLYHAEYVVTDSFHGTAFSINFNKRFYAFNPPKYSGRIKWLLEKFKLNHRLIEENYELNYCDTIDYDSVNELLEKERADTKLMMKMLC